MPKSTSTTFHILHLTYHCKFLTEVYFISVIKMVWFYNNFVLLTDEAVPARAGNGEVHARPTNVHDGSKRKGRAATCEMQFPKTWK
jgi:hypothetical protein